MRKQLEAMKENWKEEMVTRLLQSYDVFLWTIVLVECAVYYSGF